MKTLTEAQQKTKKSAVGFFLNLTTILLMVFLVGIDDVGDWFILVTAVIAAIGCAYYVQDDIRKAMREGRDA